MEELVEKGAGIPILTLTREMFISDSVILARTILTNSVIPDLLKDEDPRSRIRETYTKVLNLVHYESSSPFKVGWNLSTSAITWNSNTTRFVAGNGTIIAVVDHSDILEPLRHCLLLFGKYKPARVHNFMNFYTMRSIWFVKNNFFVDILAPGLTSLVEGGIYQRWSRNTWVTVPQLVFTAAFRNMNKRTSTAIKRKPSDEEATTLEQVGVPLNLFLGMVLAALVLFIKEVKVPLKMCGQAGVNRVFKLG